MAGCDYIENVKGIGLLKLISFYQTHSNPLDLIAYYEKKLGYQGAVEYLKDVELAMSSFLYQLVYKTNENGQVILKNLSLPPNLETTQIHKKEFENYVGWEINNFQNHFNGKTKFNDSQEKRQICQLDFVKIMKFYAFIPNPSLGFMNNLTVKTIRYDNFEEFLKPDKRRKKMAKKISRIQKKKM